MHYVRTSTTFFSSFLEHVAGRNSLRQLFIAVTSFKIQPKILVDAQNVGAFSAGFSAFGLSSPPTCHWFEFVRDFSVWIATHLVVVSFYFGLPRKDNIVSITFPSRHF